MSNPPFVAKIRFSFAHRETMMIKLFSLPHVSSIPLTRRKAVAFVSVSVLALIPLIDEPRICVADTTVVHDAATTSAIAHARDSAVREAKNSSSSHKSELLAKWDEL